MHQLDHLHWEWLINVFWYFIYIYIWNWERKSKTSRKIYMKTKYETFPQWNTKLLIQKVLFLLHSRSCQNSIALRVSSQNFTRSFVIKEPWALENHCSWICDFVPVISQRCIKYTLVHRLKLLAYLFHVRLF